jgi:hypothetical protein
VASSLSHKSSRNSKEPVTLQLSGAEAPGGDTVELSVTSTTTHKLAVLAGPSVTMRLARPTLTGADSSLQEKEQGMATMANQSDADLYRSGLG